MTLITQTNLDRAGNVVYPSWRVDLTPGAAEAFKAWQSADEAARAQYSRIPALIRERNELTRWDGNGNRVRKPGVTQAELDSKIIEIDAAEREALPLTRRAGDARATYDRLMNGTSKAVDPSTARRNAAKYALGQHEEIERLSDALLSALRRRDEAYLAAGSPGRFWALAGGMGQGNTEYSVEQGLSVWVGGFDTDAMRRAATGETVPTEQEELDAARQAVKDARYM